MSSLQDLDVLVVEDQIDQATALVAVLHVLGATARAATSGKEALALMERGMPDVLVVDVELGDMQGVDVVRFAQTRRPDQRAILMTGYPSDHPPVVEAVRATRGAYVAKPVDVPAFCRLLAALRAAP